MALTTLEMKYAAIGMHADGGGLYLQVAKGGGRSWIFRYQVNGRRREMGLGSAADLSVTQARAVAEDFKALTKKGRDPLEEKKAAEAQAAMTAAADTKREVLAGRTFSAVATQYIGAQEAGWKNAKHAQQWTNTLQTYVYPLIGELPISEVTTDHVVEILTPIWSAKPETATRVRSRLELVIAYAKAREWFQGANPAAWRGHISALLPSPSKLKNVRNHPALAWKDMADFMTGLRAMPGTGARALEFAILTAARSGEARRATWAEIDLATKVWTVPGARMKATKEHRVPLSGAAVALLEKLPRVRGEDLIFPGARSRRPLSDMSLSAVLRRMKRAEITVHGFRSAFRDWASEATLHHPDLAEQALAHAIKNKVEAAYRRGDMLEKRRVLMEEWAEWCRGAGEELGG